MTGVTLHAITVLGHDRPGIIAETTGALAALGVNLTDSTMTLLRGHFAMVLVTSGDVDTAAITQALHPLEASELWISVQVVPAESPSATPASSWVFTVYGGDRPGIVSAIVTEIAAVGGNITDLSTHLSGDMYVLVGEVDLPGDVDVAELARTLDRAGNQLGVTATMNPAEPDDL